MTIDRGYPADDEPLSPEDVDSAPLTPLPEQSSADPNDEVPVPIAMSPAEVDERAQVVEKMRRDEPGAVDPQAEPPALGG